MSSSSSRQRKQRPTPVPTTCHADAPPRSSRSILSARRPVLLSYNEIPDWYQDNDSIRHGYRPEFNSARACFASWFYMHNEIINIYTHLLPAVFFLLAEALMDHWVQVRYSKATIGDRLIFAFFLLSAATCLGLSAIYHTLMNHSMRVSDLWLRLDFVGIIVLTLGDFVSGIYMVFYCEPTLRKIYWTMILTLGVASIFILVNPKFQGRRFRTFRVSTFVFTGLSGLAPLTHGLTRFGVSQMMKQSGMPYYLVQGLVLLLGALFYTANFNMSMCGQSLTRPQQMRVPESFKAGYFDIYGCSHQIFHVLVVLATVVQLIGVLTAFDYNYRPQTC